MSPRIPSALGDSTAWMEDALCNGMDPSLWFTDSNPKRVIAICRTCPVMEACARYAQHESDEGHPVSGVWGGTTGRERARTTNGRATLIRVAREQEVIDLLDRLTGDDTRLTARAAQKAVREQGVSLSNALLNNSVRRRNLRWKR